MSEPPSFDPGRYWDRRLAGNFDLRGVGYLRYGRRYNEYLYRAKVRIVEEVVDGHDMVIEGARVLDLGCGTGFWLRWYSRQGADQVSGLDVSPSAVARLSEELPEVTVREGNVGEEWSLEGPFDIISAFDVFYHVMDDGAFDRALEQVAEQLAPGGWLLLTDRLTDDAGPDPASHVRFRSLERYRARFSEIGLSVEEIRPLYFLMNGGLANRPWIQRRPRLRWLVIRLENLLAPVLFHLDKVFASRERANLRLLVARAAR